MACTEAHVDSIRWHSSSRVVTGVLWWASHSAAIDQIGEVSDIKKYAGLGSSRIFSASKKVYTIPATYDRSLHCYGIALFKGLNKELW